MQKEEALKICEYCSEEFVPDDHTRLFTGKGTEEFCSEECHSEWLDDMNINNHEDIDDYLIDGVGFADPGGESALRAETPSNPRNLPCPTCGEPNRLTPLDRKAGYHCNSCANRIERGYDW